MKKKCECHAYSANECACGACGTLEQVDLEDIKQNGIDPKSKLFWAMMLPDVNYVAMFKDGTWRGYYSKPPIVTIEPDGDIFDFDIATEMWCADIKAFFAIKIAYTGDWKDSLHFRGDYE